MNALPLRALLDERAPGRYWIAELDGAAVRPPGAQVAAGRAPDAVVERAEREWPLARTQWTKFHLDPHRQTLSLAPPETAKAVSFAAMGDGLTFLSEPLDKETEITGPVAAKLRISSSTEDADLFLVVRVFTPESDPAR